MKSVVTLLGIAFLLFHFLFLWMYTNIDGYFYWAIGQYFQTGTYPYISPFIYAKPPTISPPLYGLALASIGSLPNGDIVLHAIHLFLLATTTLLLFRILRQFIAQQSAALISFLFLIFPTNVIYTSSMMTELPAQTAMTAYLYLFQKFLKTHNTAFVGYMLILTAAMTLLKYQFIVLFIFTVFYLSKKIFPLLCLALGITIIGLWIMTNHTITGVWGLSDTKKMPLYTNFVWDGRHYPKESDPSVIALRRYVPPTADRYAQYWDLQDYILPYANRDWTVVDELLGNVGIAAIREHPIAYLAGGIRVFFQTLTHRAPWWHHLQTYGTIDPVQPLFCGRLGTMQFCKPIIKTPMSYPLWNTYVSISRSLYDTVIPPFLVFIFLPALCITLMDPRWRVRMFSVIYLVSLVPISYLSMVESRYLIPYYPLIIMITVQGIHIIKRKVTKRA